MPMKQCKKCNKIKELSDFTNKKLNKDGKCLYCRQCTRAEKAKNRQANIDFKYMYRYGITTAEVLKMVENQNNKCYICEKVEHTKFKPLMVDHCHETGKIRGMLCQKCNQGLGLFLDSPELLEKAANYLKKLS